MMSASLDRLAGMLHDNEDEHLEFKEAKNRYDFEELTRYCVALANEGGGKMVIGVSDRRPREVVGTLAFDDLERTKAGLTERLRLRIDAEEIRHPDGRVVIFNVPSRPLGLPIEYKRAYSMRAGDRLARMTTDMLKRIIDEVRPDYSSEICPNASVADLSPSAIDRFRAMWRRKSGNQALAQVGTEQILADAELLLDGGLTYAALILFGTSSALGKHLAQAEVIFEYRSEEASLRYQQREEYREGFFLFMDDLWGTVNLRNEVHHFQDGLFVGDVPTFNEVVVREGILNAVSHRDYRLGGSVFVRQFPRTLEIVSPGGFPPGVTPESILWRQAPRNRRIAEVLAKCGLVERSGQGANLMFEHCIREGKPVPDFADSDDYQVALTLRGEIQDPQLLSFLARVRRETPLSFTTEDLLVLDLVDRDQPISERLKARVPSLLEHGILEAIGRGRGARYILSRKFYGFLGKSGVYTRKRGLDRETNKALLLGHIRDSRREGSQLRELRQVLPALSRTQVQGLLRELKAEGHIRTTGRTKGARWVPARTRRGIESERQKAANKTQL